MCRSCQSVGRPAAAIYARVSTEEQTENSSLKTQVEACLKAAADKGFLIGDVGTTLLGNHGGRPTQDVIAKLQDQRVFVDGGYSAATLDRPALSALREDAGTDFCKVFVYDLDRLARDLADLLALDRELRSAGVEVLNVVFPSDPSAPGRLLFQMRGAFAEFERAQILERLH